MGRRFFAVVLVTGLLPSAAAAQIRASEAAAVSQTVDGTVITVAYSRPLMRGRAPGPDGVFHHEHMWTPGANWGTTLEVNRPITLNGHAVTAGKFSVWAEPAAGDWTFYLHPNPRLFHTAAPKASEMTLSFKVTPQRSTESVDALTFDFPAVRHDGATLRFRWAQVVIPFDVAVEPSRKMVAMTEEQAAPYVGGWLMQMLNEVNEKSPEMKFELVLSNGALRGIVDGPEPWGIEFLPSGEPHTFVPAFLANGKLFDVEDAARVAFDVVNGRATRWYTKPAAGIGDEPWMWARRQP
jgi:hypothetical protein